MLAHCVCWRANLKQSQEDGYLYSELKGRQNYCVLYYHSDVRYLVTNRNIIDPSEDKSALLCLQFFDGANLSLGNVHYWG